MVRILLAQPTSLRGRSIFPLCPETPGNPRLLDPETEPETAGRGAFGVPGTNYLCRQIGGSEWGVDLAQANPSNRFWAAHSVGNSSRRINRWVVRSGG
jgi:hypothetical protein